MKLFFSTLFLFVLTNGIAQNAADYYKEAKALRDKKDYEKAINSIDKALSIDSMNVDYYDVKAICLEESKHSKEAFDIYTKAISLFPKQSHLYSNRGNVLLSYSQFDDAIADYTMAMDLAEHDSLKRLAITNRGAAKYSKRDFQGAYDDLIAAYHMDTTDIAVLTNLGSVCDEIGRGDETLKFLLKAVQIDPTFAGAYANIGFKYQEMGDNKKAIEYYNKVIELDPNEALGYSNRGYNKLKLGDTKGAMADVSKSLQLYGENSYAYRIRALVYIDQKEFDKACIDLQTALDKGFTVTYGNEVIDLQKKYCTKN